MQRVPLISNDGRWIAVRVEKVSASGVRGALKKVGSMKIYTTKVSVEGECESERHRQFQAVIGGAVSEHVKREGAGRGSGRQ